MKRPKSLPKIRGNIMLGSSKGSVHLIDLDWISPRDSCVKPRLLLSFNTNPVSTALHFTRLNEADVNFLFVGGEMCDTIVFSVVPRE